MPYITPDGNYTESLYVAEGSIEVPVRPSPSHIWQGGAWVVSFALLKATETAQWMALREPYFGRLASIASRLYATDPAGSASADAVANSLLGLFTDAAVVAATDITAYKAALKSRYAQAIAFATPSVAAEFGKYDK